MPDKPEKAPATAEPVEKGDKGVATAQPETHPDMSLVGQQPKDSTAAAKPVETLEHQSRDQMTQMWDQAVAANGGKPLTVIKGYYEAGVRKVDGAEHPNGLVLSSSESTMTLKNDMTVTYPDGKSETFKAGTQLPNGYQIAPDGGMSADGETRTMKGASLIKTGPTGEVLSVGKSTADVVVEKGQFSPAEGYIVSRPSVDLETGKPRIDTYTNKDLSRWVAVDGQPNVFSPKLEGAAPVNVIKVPEGKQGTFDVSYGGTAPFKPGDLIVREDKTQPDGTKVPGYRRISEGDALETYRGADPAAVKALDDSARAIAEKYPEVKLTRAAADQATFQLQKEAEMHRGTDYMKQMWDDAVKQNGGKPLEVIKGYYEAGVRQVDALKHPEGLILSSTESTMTLKNDVTVNYPGGKTETFKAGSRLPNGYQISPREMTVDGETRTMKGATLIKTGPHGEVLSTGEISGNVVVDKGQFAKPESFIVSRPAVDLETGKPRIDTYTNKDLSRWVAVDGKPGVFSPKLEGASPVGVIKVPEGKMGTFDVSYGGTAPFRPGDLIVREDKTAPDGVTKVPAFRRISEEDGLSTYRGADAAGTRALEESSRAISEKYPGVKITRAAADKASFYSAQSPGALDLGDAFKKKPPVERAAVVEPPHPAKLDLGAAVAMPTEKGAPAQSEEFRRVQVGLAQIGLDENARKVAGQEMTRLAAMDPAERAKLLKDAREIVRDGRSEEVARQERASGKGRLGGLLMLSTPALEYLATHIGG